MERKKLIVLIGSVLTIIVLIVCSLQTKDQTPKNVYQVYLDGEVIGLVENKDELLNLINEEQQDIKDTYNVDQVYPPNGFDIEEYITYDDNITSAGNIYQKIKDQSDFTVE